VPTILSHPAVPLALGLGLGSRVIPRPLLVAGVIASVVPDFDVVAFRFGIAYSHAAGHRGFTHSIAFALALGFLALLFADRFKASRPAAFAFILVAALSHSLLDMLTNGGLGVALLWPVSEGRFFFPVQPIEVSPLSISRVFGEAGARVFTSELLWVWLPSLAVLCLLRLVRRQNAP
jgi:inner membrane protein